MLGSACIGAAACMSRFGVEAGAGAALTLSWEPDSGFTPACEAARGIDLEGFCFSGVL